MIKIATVRYSNDKTCFVAIPRNWNLLLCEQHVFEIKKDDVVAYLSWNGNSTVAKDVIEINRKYCHHLGFAEYDEVLVKEITQTVDNCKEAFLIPPDADGFELIDLNSEVIEQQLMKQIRIIWKGQVFPLWINNIEVVIEISNTFPSNLPVKLVIESAVNIKDVNDSISQPSANNLVNSVVQRMHKSGSYINSKKLSCLKYGMMSTLRNTWLKFKEIGYDYQLLCKDNYAELLSKVPISLVLHVNPVEDYLFTSKCTSHSNVISKLKGVKYPSAVYISSSVLPDSEKDVPEIFLAKISKLLSPLEKLESRGNNKQGIGRNSMFEKRKNFSSRKEPDSLNEEKHFSSSIVQVIVLTYIERSCSGCIRDELNITFESGSIIIPDGLRKMLGLEISSHIHLQSINYMPSILDTIHLYPVLPVERSLSENIASIFESWLEAVYDQSLPFIFCNGNVITLPIQDSSVDFVLKASLDQSSGSSSYLSADKDDKLQAYWNISPSVLLTNVTCKLESVLESVKVNGISLPTPSLCLIDNIPVGPNLNGLGGIDAVSKKALQFLELWLNISPISKSLLPAKEPSSTLLICGPKGGGKTALSQALCKKLSQSPYHIYCHFISCRTLKGKRGETLWKNWQNSCSDVVHREPAILVIDDLDVIASAPTTPEEEVSSNGIHFQKIVHAFLNLCACIKSSGARVIIIATAKSFQSLHPLLTSTRGEHVFQHKIEINYPTKDQREKILKALVESKLNITLNDSNLLHQLASKTESCVARDLDTLVNRATHSAWMRNDLTPSLNKCKPFEVSLTEADFNTALQNFIPSSLQSVHLHKSGNKQWSDVGGLSEVKDALHKILLWPAKYPSLFANCPLRLQSGILLYGPPGTGKTLIAGVIAKESGLNFIHIKGPELLSKYIGASEQALRNAFSNAQNAKPCILFFDEFDALAPRRGHDSTGVTDRVVNQMLTQMDGVESLDGVYILAATSRPDLIDPALLRPGRLDKHLYCPLPDEDDRLQILLALSRKLCLSEDVDLSGIAVLTANFSGADLQALLYSAQIENLHQVQNDTNQGKDVLDKSSEDCEMIYFPSIEEGPVVLDSEQKQRIKNEIDIIQRNINDNEQIRAEDYDKKPSLVYINNQNLIAALDKMRPSVSPTERAKYQLVYSRFARGGSDTTTMADSGGKRVTLA